MEQLALAVIAGVFGGSLLTKLVDRLFDRRKDGQQVHFAQEDQTLKWSEKALAVAEELMQTKLELTECEQRCLRCENRLAKGN